MLSRRSEIVFASRVSKCCSLREWACAIEDHYSKLAGKHQPMDIEWAKDGITGELFILQARPETVHAQKADENFIENYELTGGHGAPLSSGVAVGEKIGHGKAHVHARRVEADQLSRKARFSSRR